MPKKIVITSSIELVSVSPTDIVYLSSDGNYSVMTLTDGSQLTFSFNLQSFGQLLVDQLQSEAQAFIRIGRSLIINREYVFRINPNKQQLVLVVGVAREKFNLTASKEALRQVKQLLESEL